MVDKPSTSISLSVSVIRPLFLSSIHLFLAPFSLERASLLSSSLLLSLYPPIPPPPGPRPTAPPPPVATLPPFSISLSSFTLEISITGSTPNPHQPLCHLRPLLSTPSSTPDSLPLGPACCLVACTVSHRCSSLQRQYSSRQLRSAV